MRQISRLPGSGTGLNRLKRRWGLVAGLYLLAIGAFYLLLHTTSPLAANHWLGITILVAGYSLSIVWRYLPQNHRPGETAVLPTFGWGNRLTLLRGLNISLVAGFLFSSWPGGWLGWLPAILYTSADIADNLDGYAARKTNHATRLGETLDMEFDSLGLIVVTLLAVWWGQLPWWYLGIGLARYLFIFGLWLRQRLGRPNRDLPFSWHRRLFAGLQMGFMSVVLWPIVPVAVAVIAGTMFALATSASFLRDWWIVIGWLDPAGVGYRRWQRRLVRLTRHFLPPLWRLLLLLAVALLFSRWQTAWQPAAWVDLFYVWQLPAPEMLATFFAVTGLLATVLIGAGFMGRLLTLPLMFPLGFTMLATGADLVNGTAMACGVAILLLGTGLFSLWQPEEKFIFRRAGETAAL